MVRDGAEQSKRTPYLSFLLIAGAVICQSLVLAGNMHTVHSLHKLAHSSGGWATTGLNLADSFGEFSMRLFAMSKTMALAIDDILIIEQALDKLILNISGTMGRRDSGPRMDAVKGASPDTDSFIQVHLSVSSDSLGPHDEAFEKSRFAHLSPAAFALLKGPCLEVARDTGPLIAELKPKLRRLERKLGPPLRRIQRWLTELSNRVQSYIGHFGIALGRVQEIFDVVTESFARELTSDEEMIEQTYNLFDTSNTGLVSIWDLGNVSQMFGINFLQGDRAAALFEQYDSNGDDMLDKEEFGRMMLDPSTPAMMATVLRAYADRLAQVAGPLKRAETRTEVARAVTSYLQTVAAKNMTKVGWMAQALTNGSLPLNFTVSVLNHLALAAEDPNRIATVDAGAVIVRRMVDFSPATVRHALEFMVSPESWVSEGLDLELQASVVERVARWAAAAGISSGAAVCSTLIGTAHVEVEREASFSGRLKQIEEEMEALPKLYRWRAERGSRSYAAARRAANTRTTDALLGSQRSRQLLEELLGTMLPASTQTSPEATRAVQKGKVAAPEVLQFAKWLAKNASRTAAMLTTRCFDYSARMSHHVQGLSSKMQGVSDKVFMALQLFSRYTSPEAVDDMASVFNSFEERASKEVFELCQRLVQEDPLSQRLRLPPNSTWAKIFRIMKEVKTLLPDVIESMEAAQMQTSSFSSSLSSVFEVMTDKLPFSFHLSASFWKGFWVTYFILFLIVDLLMLFWISWASGCLSQKTAESAEGEGKEVEEYEPPRTMKERFQVCMTSCNACMESRFVDKTMLFWSLLLLIELCIFVSFIFTLLLCMLAVLKIFIYSGCNQLYMLGDHQVCAEVMSNIKFWLTSFLNKDFLTPLTVCDERLLLTCKLVSEDLLKSSVLTVVGGILGSFLNFQVIVESAILHERLRWRRAMDKPQTEL